MQKGISRLDALNTPVYKGVMSEDKSVQVRINSKVHKRLKVLAARQQLTISGAIALLLK